MPEPEIFSERKSSSMTTMGNLSFMDFFLKRVINLNLLSTQILSNVKKLSASIMIVRLRSY